MAELTTTDKQAPAPLWQGLFWPTLVIAMLGGQVFLLSVMAYVATMDASFAVEPDYYQKALHWDDTAAQYRANDRLGWSIRTAVGEATGVLGERTLTCTLTDRGGNPMEAAVVDLVAFPHARGGQRSSAVMAPAGGGDYEATLRFTRTGLWEFRFSVSRGGEVFTHTETRDVHPAGESQP